MISPETFIKTYENKSYNQLLVIRQSLLNDIYAFETAKPKDTPESNISIWPAEEVVYQSDFEISSKNLRAYCEKARARITEVVINE